MRRYGGPRRSGQHYKYRPGAYAVLFREKQALLTYQGAPHFEMQLPGGGIDPGESAISALHREVFEETGWSISRPRKLGSYRRFTYLPEYDMWAEKICHIFLARPILRYGLPLEKDHTAIWLPKKAAGNILTNEGDRDFFLAALNG